MKRGSNVWVWAGALLMVVVLVPFASVHLSGQGQAATASDVPRTPWGAPDLQGIWNMDHQTPFQRAEELGEREFFTDEEVAERLEALNGRPVRNEYRDTRKGIGTEQDVAGAYNAVWQSDRRTEVGRRTSQVIDPPNGRVPPTLAAVQQREAATDAYLEDLLQGSSGGRPGEPIAGKSATHPPSYNLDRMNRADGPEDRSSSERCFGSNLPAMGTLQRLVQSPDSVQIFYDRGQGQGFSRVIPITDMPHLPSNIRQFYGDARGRWEGDTLVVDVTNFTNRADFRGSRENRHLVERYTRTGPDTLTYQVTVEDPTTWTRPWTALVELDLQDNTENFVFEQTCHEGNYGLVGMLSNTRAAEKLYREGKGKDPNTMDIATGGGGGRD